MLVKRYELKTIYSGNQHSHRDLHNIIVEENLGHIGHEVEM